MIIKPDTEFNLKQKALDLEVAEILLKTYSWSHNPKHIEGAHQFLQYAEG
jgi:hypothetical protein